MIKRIAVTVAKEFVVPFAATIIIGSFWVVLEIHGLEYLNVLPVIEPRDLLVLADKDPLAFTLLLLSIPLWGEMSRAIAK